MDAVPRFSLNRSLRNEFCRNKDKVLIRFLEDISIPDPSKFHALLMPALYGMEAFYLVDQGIPACNLFAIEDNRVDRNKERDSEERLDENPHLDPHREIIECKLPDRQELKGMRTTTYPMEARLALDEAYYSHCKAYDLIYLDFLSQPGYRSHYRCISKILKMRMLSPTGRLILNFGVNRCPKETKDFNEKLAEVAEKNSSQYDGSLPTEVYVNHAIVSTKHDPYKWIRSEDYQSPRPGGYIVYTTTGVQW